MCRLHRFVFLGTPKLARKWVWKCRLLKTYVCFCLKINSRQHIWDKEFKKINKLPKKEKVEQCAATHFFKKKYRESTSPFYVNKRSVHSRNMHNTRSHMALKIPLRKSNLVYKSISFMGPSIWKKLSNDLKILNTTTLFTHNYKKRVLQKPERVEFNFKHNFPHYNYSKLFYYYWYHYY